MNARQGFRYLLQHDAAVAAIVTGQDARARIYPLRLPPNVVLPCLVYLRVDRDSWLSHSGPSGKSTARFQLDTWANDVDTMEELARAAKLALHGFRGDVGPVDDQVYFDQIRLVNEVDQFDDPTLKYRVIQDYMVTYQET